MTTSLPAASSGRSCSSLDRRHARRSIGNVTEVLQENEEAQRAWDGVLFDRFVQFRHLVVGGLAPLGTAALELDPPRPGDRVVDVGCGFGDTALQIAELVGPAGSVLGVDVAPRFIETARAEAQEAGAPNVRFETMDVQATAFDETFDYAFSRFGTMFFASPVAALRNVRRALVPGGRLCIVVWRRKLDNPWIHRAEQVVKPLIEVPEETDEPRCGPGPFSMADADTTSQILLGAGFDRIAFHRCDLPFTIGRIARRGDRRQPGARPGRGSGSARRGRRRRGSPAPRRAASRKRWPSSRRRTAWSRIRRSGSSPPARRTDVSPSRTARSVPSRPDPEELRS